MRTSSVRCSVLFTGASSHFFVSFRVIRIPLLGDPWAGLSWTATGIDRERGAHAPGGFGSCRVPRLGSERRRMDRGGDREPERHQLGLYDRAELDRMHRYLHDMLHRGARCPGILYCPHHPNGGKCLCRKPDAAVGTRCGTVRTTFASVMVGDRDHGEPQRRLALRDADTTERINS